MSGTWSYSKSAQGSWPDGYLRPALTNSVNGLVVADFNGDGIADVATTDSSSPRCSSCWLISYSGTGDWTTYSEFVPLYAAVGIGHFLGNRGVDVLLWNTYQDFLGCATRTALPMFSALFLEEQELLYGKAARRCAKKSRAFWIGLVSRSGSSPVKSALTPPVDFRWPNESGRI